MNRLKCMIKDRRGLMTTEAAILMPLMLVALCIVLAFMFLFYKWGASQLIFNHLDLSAKLGVAPVYHLEMLSDQRTEIRYNKERQRILGEVDRYQSEAELTLKPPYLEKTKALLFKSSTYSLSFQREVQLVQWLNGSKD